MKEKSSSEYIQDKIQFEKDVNKTNYELYHNQTKEFFNALSDPDLSDEELYDILMPARELKIKLKNWKLVKPTLGFKVTSQKEMAVKNIDKFIAMLDGIVEECNIRLENRSKRKEIQKLKSKGELSAFEIALRHWYLVYGKEENYIIPKQVGEKYQHLVDKTNIAKSYSRIDKAKGKIGTKAQLLKIHDSLSDFPKIQKAIINNIDELD
ncbi:hypothetical protein [Daejeonella sp. H1SJ63]|uniref:hypothetical protein n=1 Tax=Daejeonella sp. H1SJ63 TaxID=3034145 RepID=UPI0023ECD059|nr:hypothetical protein [Daejeonella sp. H1SJ63]